MASSSSEAVIQRCAPAWVAARRAPVACSPRRPNADLSRSLKMTAGDCVCRPPFASGNQRCDPSSGSLTGKFVVRVHPPHTSELPVASSYHVAGHTAHHIVGCALLATNICTGIQREEDKVKKSIKEAAKRNDTSTAKMLAKEIVRSRKAVNRMHTSKAQMNSVVMQMENQLGARRSHAVTSRTMHDGGALARPERRIGACSSLVSHALLHLLVDNCLRARSATKGDWPHAEEHRGDEDDGQALQGQRDLRNDARDAKGDDEGLSTAHDLRALTGHCSAARGCCERDPCAVLIAGRGHRGDGRQCNGSIRRRRRRGRSG